MLSGTSGRLGVGVNHLVVWLLMGGREILRGFTATGLSSRSLETGDSAPLLSTLMIEIDETRSLANQKATFEEE
jgi:hypothetical protein